MPAVLTTASNVTCGHSPGKVSTSSSAKLTVSGSPVLDKDGVQSKSVSGCGTTPASDSSGPTASKCLSVASVTAGEATKLEVDGKPAMLATLKGSTDGMVAKTTPQLLLGAQALQQKLTAV